MELLLAEYPVKLYLCGDKHKVRVRKENWLLEITMGCSVEEIGSTAVFSVVEMKKDSFSFNAEWKKICYQWQPFTALNDLFRRNQTEVITKVHPISPKEIFIGRNREIDEIKRRLEDNHKIILLYGLEGIGKTELCRRICQQYLSESSKIKKIGWIAYRNTIKDSFWRQFPVIEEKGEPKESSASLQFASPQPGDGEITNKESYWSAVKKYISKQEQQDLLLILDNANEITDSEMLSLKQLDCRLILTSRKRLENVNCINVTHLEREECLELYHIHSGKRTEDRTADDAAIEHIISLISGHTLLIELLAKLQIAAGITSEELYQRLKKEGFDLSDMTEDISFLHNTEMDSQEVCNSRITEHIKKILNISEISQNQEKMQIMQFFALLLPGCAITMQTAKKWLNLQNLNIINALVADGWLERSTQNNIPVLTMHPLIYIGICDMLPQNEELETLWVKNAAGDVMIKEKEAPADKINILLPAEALINNVHIRNREYIELMGSFGGIYIANGEYQNALNFYENVLKIEKEILDNRDICIAKTFNTFGAIYDGQVKYNEALEWLKKGAEMHREILGDAHMDTAVSYSNVASMYVKLNMLDEANKWIEQAFGMLKLLPDQKDSSNAAIIYATKGNCCLKEGNLDTAKAYFKKAIEIRKNTVGDNHSITMGLYANIAAIYHA